MQVGDAESWRDTNGGEDSWFNGDHFQTFTGKHFYLLRPRPEDVCIEDIAHALARTCRYGGHVAVDNYSVAEHCVLIAEYVLAHPEAYTRAHALEALLHDAGEAYYGDLKRPIKHEPSIAAVIDPIFRRVDEVVRSVFHLPWTESEAIKTLDCRIVRDEKAQVMRGPADGDNGLYPPLGVTIVGMFPSNAEDAFLRLYKELTE